MVRESSFVAWAVPVVDQQLAVKPKDVCPPAKPCRTYAGPHVGFAASPSQPRKPRFVELEFKIHRRVQGDMGSPVKFVFA